MGDCSTGTAALRGLLQSEYGYNERSRNAARAAFEWYPATADLAGSADLGFTAGPYTYSVAAGARAYGHFLTIWKRDATCRWEAEFDGEISHAAPLQIEPNLEPGEASFTPAGAPSAALTVGDAVGRAISDFQATSTQDGLAPALRIYARTADFCLYAGGEAPMELAAANRYLAETKVLDAWHETARDRSADSSLGYCAGALGDDNRPGGYAYAQIWQYAPRVANWGLRILLLNPLSAMSK